MGNNTNKKKKNISLSGSSIAAYGAIAGICFCVLFIIFRAAGVGAATESEDAKNGAIYVSSIEKRDVKEISERIGKEEKEENREAVSEKLAALDDEETDIWSLFEGIVIVGDSRAESFVEYGFLPERVVEAKKGANLKYADESIEDVVARNPKSIIFNYGINDITGNWHNADDFIARYEEIIEMYKQKLPNTDIFVCSIIPVHEQAVIDDPTLEYFSDYARAVKLMCEEKGYILIDCDDLYDYSELYEDEGMHFKPDMYPIWAKMLLRGVFTYENEQSAKDSGENN